MAVQKAARGRDARKAAKGKATTATTAKAAKGAAADQQKGAAEAPLRPEDISQQDMLMIQVESAAEALAASQEEAATTASALDVISRGVLPRANRRREDIVVWRPIVEVELCLMPVVHTMSG